MRTHRLTALAILLLLALPGSFAEDGVSFGATADLASAYHWRGMIVNDEAVLQPGVTLDAGSFTFGVWGNLDLTDFVDRSGEFTEIDLSVAYGFSAGKVDFELGAVQYRFPGSDIEETEELYLTTTFSDLPLSPSVSLYYDIGEIEGLYASFGVSRSFELGEKSSFDLSASTGWGNEDYHAGYFGGGGSALSDGSLAASFGFTLPRGFTLGVSGTYTWLWDGTISDYAPMIYPDDAGFVGMVSLAWSGD